MPYTWHRQGPAYLYYRKENENSESSGGPPASQGLGEMKLGLEPVGLGSRLA